MKMPEAIGWEYRFKESHPQTVKYGQWYPWERLIPRNPLETVEGRVAEIQCYINRGYSYELRAFYDKQALIDLLEAAAALVAPKRQRPCDCGVCDCGNRDDAQRVAEWDADNTAAQEILKLKETL